LSDALALRTLVLRDFDVVNHMLGWERGGGVWRARPTTTNSSVEDQVEGHRPEQRCSGIGCRHVQPRDAIDHVRDVKLVMLNGVLVEGRGPSLGHQRRSGDFFVSDRVAIVPKEGAGAGAGEEANNQMSESVGAGPRRPGASDTRVNTDKQEVTG
jgi:hypothetical protein